MYIDIYIIYVCIYIYNTHTYFYNIYTYIYIYIITKIRYIAMTEYASFLKPGTS